VPQDRESVFWLNVLEIPPKPVGKANHIQLTVRSRLKLFYRPAGLAGSPKAAVAQLRWRLVRGSGLCAGVRESVGIYRFV
jgi:chaperone protein EcpD